MKKITLALGILLLLVPLVSFAQTNISTNQNIQALVDKSTSVAGSPISLQLKFVPEGRGCGGSIAYDRLVLKQNGSVISTVYDSSPVNGEEYIYSAVSVNSNTVGTVNMAVDASCFDGADYTPVVSIAVGSLVFTAAPAAPSTTTTVKLKTTTATTTPPTAVVTPPAAPVLEVIAGNNPLVDQEEDIILNQNEEKTFSGKTIPNGIVHLYFHSDPFEDTAVADANGVWTYTLNRDLGTGNHTLQVAVTDPATNLTSEKTAEQKFTLVTAAKSEEATPVATKTNYFWYLVGGGVILAIVLGVLGYLYFTKKWFFAKKSKIQEQEVEKIEE